MLVKRITDEAGAAYLPHPSGTEIVKRRSGEREYVMLLNHTPDAVEMGVSGISLLHGGQFDGTLGGYEVELLETS